MKMNKKDYRKESKRRLDAKLRIKWENRVKLIKK